MRFSWPKPVKKIEKKNVPKIKNDETNCNE